MHLCYLYGKVIFLQVVLKNDYLTDTSIGNNELLR